MEWQFVIALLVAVPIIIFPVAFIWYINISGVRQSVKEVIERRVAQEKEANNSVEAKQPVSVSTKV